MIAFFRISGLIQAIRGPEEIFDSSVRKQRLGQNPFELISRGGHGHTVILCRSSRAEEDMGNQAIWDRFENLEHVFSIISELDPRFYDPYDVGSLIAYYDAKDLDLAIRILDLGMEKNPDQWIFPLQAGHYAQMFAQDFQKAKMYYSKAMNIEGSPPIAQRLYANAAFEQSDYQTAWQNWLEVYETTEDERVKKIASNHLYRTKATMDIQAINRAIRQFQDRHGRLPRELSELITAGFLPNIPKDLDEKEYVYDGRTGEVRTRVNPWKR